MLAIMYFPDRGCVHTLLTLYIYATGDRHPCLFAHACVKPDFHPMQRTKRKNRRRFCPCVLAVKGTLKVCILEFVHSNIYNNEHIINHHVHQHVQRLFILARSSSHTWHRRVAVHATGRLSGQWRAAADKTMQQSDAASDQRRRAWATLGTLFTHYLLLALLNSHLMFQIPPGTFLPRIGKIRW